MPRLKTVTNIVVYNDGKLLLGYKKRGFGEGKWNSFGGKVGEGETVEESVLRELEEEVGIKATQFEKKGVLVFNYPDDDSVMESHIFCIYDFNGEPTESEEMSHRWFEISEIPYDKMWPDDIHWMPILLAGKNFKGSFLFSGPDIVSFDLEEAEKL